MSTAPQGSPTDAAHTLVPHCGETRGEEEFSYAGEAHIRRPPDPGASVRRGVGRTICISARTRAGPHREIWLHTAGCRRYFNVLRDTVSYEILEVYPMDLPAPGSPGETTT